MSTEDYKKQIVDALAEGLSSGKIPSPNITLGDYVEKKIIVESGGIAEQNNYYGTDKAPKSHDSEFNEEEASEPEQQTATPAPPPSDFELEDSVVFLEKPQIGITKEVSKSRVRAILLEGCSKKAILEELFTLHNRNIDLFKLEPEKRLQWLNSVPSNFQGKFKQSDLKYYREMKGDDEPRRRTR